MNEELREAVVSWIKRYLAGEATASQFEAWFLPASWNVTQWGDETTQALVGTLGLWFSEYDRGHRTDEELQQLLGGLGDELAQEVASSRS